MYRYRIYTENRLSSIVAKIVQRYFKEFSVFYGTGVWLGTTEKSMIIEILMPKNRMVDVEVICHKINRMNHQECCLITVDRVKTTFIHG